MRLAAKSAPDPAILSFISEAGISAVELYTSRKSLSSLRETVAICRDFPFEYAVHAPTSDHMPDELFRLAEELKAGIMVFHDIYFEKEWEYIHECSLKGSARVCVENITSAVEPIRFMRKFGFHRCLDIEHLYFELNGFFEEAFIDLLNEARHIHLTGYTPGSRLWHTHFSDSPDDAVKILDLLDKTGYDGLVVSEARRELQTSDEFKRLHDFFAEWQASRKTRP
jgi:sugar phosphate isomerase/epimerase